MRGGDWPGPAHPRVRNLLLLHLLTPHLIPPFASPHPPPRPPPPSSALAAAPLESGSSFVEVVASPRRAAVASMSDEEVSDPKALLEDRSKAKCVYQWYEYQKCVKRIEDDETGQKHCTGQYFDYWKCVDKNVAEKLFDSLK
uniref:Complex III subunit VI n=1 Tax=Oryza glumipatula TaxID=40148 RepID=A0A0D9YTC6_9ORYZ